MSVKEETNTHTYIYCEREKEIFTYVIYSYIYIAHSLRENICTKACTYVENTRTRARVCVCVRARATPVSKGVLSKQHAGGHPSCHWWMANEEANDKS